MAETTQDERDQPATDDEREQRATQDEQEPQAREDEQEREGSEEDQNSEADQESKAPDLPEPEEKSADDLLGQQMVDPHGVTIGKVEALFIHGQGAGELGIGEDRTGRLELGNRAAARRAAGREPDPGRVREGVGEGRS